MKRARTRVMTEVGWLDALDFCDGVLVNDTENLWGDPVYIPGWRIKHKTGDMCHSVLVRRDPGPAKEYSFVLREDNK